MKILDFILPALSPKFNPHFFPLGRGGGPAGNYAVPRSLRFRASASAYLGKTHIAGTTPVDTSNFKKTYSGVVKRGALGANGFLISNYASDTNFWYFGFVGDNFALFNIASGTTTLNKITSAAYRDPSATYHIVVTVDTTLAVAEDRFQVAINGVRVTSFSTNVIPAQNSQAASFLTPSAGTWVANQGRLNNGLHLFDGYLSEVNFIDGQALTPSSFGQIDPTTGQWVAKKYTGTYGTNGFYLPFDDATNLTTLTADKSGNGNNWASNGISLTAGVTYDSMLDVPSGNAWADGGNGRGNYATLNPLDHSGVTLGRANLYASTAGGRVRGTQFLETGKWYWETIFVNLPSTTAVGVASDTYKINTSNDLQSRMYLSNGQKISNGVASAYASSIVSGDVIGTALDMDAGTITFYKNGVSLGIAFSDLSGFCFAPFLQGGFDCDINFGQRPFAYTPPTGFKALHTGNLPEPAIKKPTDHHNVYTVTKAGDTNFTLDWDATVYDTLFWIKRRDAAGNWFQIDGLRGYDKYLSSNTTAAEVTDANVIGVAGTTITLKSTLPDGVYVIEAWKAGRADSRQTNTSGTITSTVSANVLAGFSIVAYTGTGANATVGHGLGAVAKMLGVRNRTSTTLPWLVYHSSFVNTAYLSLNTTDALTSAPTAWNSTSPTSAVFSIGTGLAVNTSGAPHVAYCFAEVPQYSKFGSYIANATADNAFAYTAEAPISLFAKCSSTTGNWVDIDTVRQNYNVQGPVVLYNSNAAESAQTYLDANGNGFKVRSLAADIGAAQTYIYASWGVPIKYANAR